eukprot:CAMPEP_0113434996 /NCGR_PEP_ID=MMETSP0013_2-20120614/35995_1 /TAXON_ID=2843 ORGANISM="Skeletonema costatum, Strain 1716" /NCGR_SAMPLE_ID=MMETSP0013_2 /ASSEMBLY_ACC=CAM_ASM_000158 /LENGTH=92 /DNA_ID=CAMNT_0000325251 /DNA_START=96 /DNA_END=371 /DNA_ORIENTATION=- /assembly_acc=CAM_ASM_000158
MSSPNPDGEETAPMEISETPQPAEDGDAQEATDANSTQQTATQGLSQPSMEPIQSIAQRLLSLRGSPPGTLANLTENEIKLLCQRVRPILLA